MTRTGAAMPTRRDVMGGLAALAAAGPAVGAEPLTLWGIPATPSAVFARAVASDSFQTDAPGARFDVWKSTDQMRAGIASGRFRLFATSTYAAAGFFNRGAGVRMVNVVTWGVLYVMARDDSIRRIDDLAGKKVLLSNRHEAPDLLFRLALGWAGLEAGRDVTLDYVGSPGEAVPLFLSGRGDVAVMHEPAATAALIRAERAGLPLFRAIDITEVYGHHTGRGPRIPQVGLAASSDLLDTAPEIVAAAHHACVDAGAWVLAHPDVAGAATAPLLGLPAPVIARSLPFVHLDVVSAREAQEDIAAYLNNLMALAPGIVGGRLPEDGFYWG
ncbi:putative sulfonate/nitrate transport system substrate-binding protein [Rhodovulum sp. P5]|uniref:ABC transporter substrate-binding protein n=1 Tax=Rhodovulum sp. P5 TaxID=1564506 RepID=UPI0009C23494|nr:PhnD/SsuA/transferrin family substrate-binding protein [Rhodovulum sp. P5]ARE41986.1 putative sulfonate/nitrate transport system substrate-binding protein [Rhodovulum sp. P5]